MTKQDEEKTEFITPCGMYYFVRMPFGLKSTGPTFARAVQIGFEPQLHRNMEDYMDDIVVKTKDTATLVQDLEETFANLRKINLKLNPEKCVFGVRPPNFSGSLCLSVGSKQIPTRSRRLSN